MRLSKFIPTVLFVTCFSLLYVYQQTEIFRNAYIGQKKIVSLQDLLDKNSLLRYNKGKYISLVTLGKKVSGSADFQMPDTYRLVRLATSQEGLKVEEKLPSRQTLLSRVFGIKRQAEAKTINP